MTQDGFDKRGADRLAREVARLVNSKVIDSRSRASDAMLDYLQVGWVDGPTTVPEWCEQYDKLTPKGGE